MRLYKLVTTDSIEGAALTWHGTKREAGEAARTAKLEHHQLLAELIRRAEAEGQAELARDYLNQYDDRKTTIIPVEFECTRRGVLQLLQAELSQIIQTDFTPKKFN